jgi:hypothetical protein
LAVYSDAEKAQLAQRLCPDIQIVTGDLLAICKRHHRKIGAAFLNLNRDLSEEFFDTVFGVLAHGMKDGGVLGVSFTSGGETGAIAVELDSQLEEMRGFVARMLTSTPREVIGSWAHAMKSGAIIPVRETTYSKLYELMDRDATEEGYSALEKEAAKDLQEDMTRITSAESAISRSDYYNYFVVSEGTKRRNGLAPRRVFYHENEVLTKCISMGIVHRAYIGEGIQKYRRRFTGFIQSSHMKAPVPCSIADDDYMRTIAKAARREMKGVRNSDVPLIPALFSITEKQLAECLEQPEETEE